MEMMVLNQSAGMVGIMKMSKGSRRQGGRALQEDEKLSHYDETSKSRGEEWTGV